MNQLSESSSLWFIGGVSSRLFSPKLKLPCCVGLQEWVANFEKPKGDPSAFLKPATTVLSPYLKVSNKQKEVFQLMRSNISIVKRDFQCCHQISIFLLFQLILSLLSLFIAILKEKNCVFASLDVCLHGTSINAFRMCTKMSKSTRLHRFPLLDR